MATRSNSKPPQRKRGLTGIRPVHRGGRWRWRAVCTIKGRRRVGALRDDQQTAHLDYLKLKEGGRGAPAVVVTLEEGLAAAITHKRTQGNASERSLDSARTYCRALLEAWTPDAPLSRVATADEINYYIRRARSIGRSNATIASKDLQILRLACRLAKVEWPEGVASLRRERTPMPFFDPDEVAVLVERVRSEPYIGKNGVERQIPDREFDANLFQFMFCTGVRLGEVGRLRVSDFDLDRCRVRVVNRKDGNSVVDVRFPQEILEGVRHLLAGKAHDAQILPGGEKQASLIFQNWKRRLREPRLHGRALRHTHITLALYDTGDPAVAREAGRHRSLAMTGRYVHAVNQKHDDRLSALGARFAPPRRSREEGDESNPSSADQGPDGRSSDQRASD